MKNSNRIALIACALLVAASVLFVFGGDSSVTNPSTVNTRGLGLAAYAELLRRNGIDIESDRSPVIRLSQSDVLVVTDYSDRQTFQFQSSDEEGGSSDPDRDEYADETPPTPKQPSQIEQSISRHLAQGGRVMMLGMPSNQPETRPSGEPIQVVGARGEARFLVQCMDSPTLRTPDPTEMAVVLLRYDQEPFALLSPTGGGVTLEVTDATFLRNRFVAKEDNAELAIWLARRFLPKGGRMVFAEATAGNAETRTALDEVGKWATAAFWQAMLVLAVVAATLSRRFGVASRELTRARGAKELMVAMGDTLERARRQDHALLILRNAAIERIRSALRLSAGMSEQQIIALMPPDAQMLMAHIIRLQGHEVDSKTAVNLAQSLESHLRDIESQERARRAPRMSG